MLSVRPFPAVTTIVEGTNTFFVPIFALTTCTAERSSVNPAARAKDGAKAATRRLASTELASHSARAEALTGSSPGCPAPRPSLHLPPNRRPPLRLRRPDRRPPWWPRPRPQPSRRPRSRRRSPLASSPRRRQRRLDPPRLQLHPWLPWQPSPPVPPSPRPRPPPPWPSPPSQLPSPSPAASLGRPAGRPFLP